jgi:D-glycero-D-manno-heptose 1,7-bisphosphate phosphatase
VKPADVAGAGQPAVFLDRDGTMIHDVGYLARRDELRWYASTIDAVRLLNRAGFLVFVVTNQGGIGLGHFTEAFVRETHQFMAETLAANGARVDGWLYCPHHPRAVIPELMIACDCRKPGRGLIDAALRDHRIDLAASFVVGDRQSDVDLAAAFGGRGVLVRTGYGEGELQALGGAMPGAACVAPDLMAATSWMLATSEKAGS